MNNFFLTFLSSYITTSTSCFLLDIFNPSLRLHEDSLENIVKHYKHVSNVVTTNILINALPLYLFLEIYYYNYQSERGIFVRCLQLLLSLFIFALRTFLHKAAGAFSLPPSYVPNGPYILWYLATLTSIP